MALKSCLVNVKVTPLESIREIEEGQFWFQSDIPLKRTKVCNLINNHTSKELGPSLSQQLALGAGCTITTPYFTLYRPLRKSFPTPQLQSIDMNFDFESIKKLLIQDAEIEKIDLKEFSDHIKGYQSLFYGQKTTFVSDYKRIKNLILTTEHLPHNNHVLKSGAIYIAYFLLSSFLCFMFVLTIRGVYRRRTSIGHQLMETVLWPYDKTFGRHCPRTKRATQEYIAPSSQRKLKLQELEARVESLDKRTNNVHLKLLANPEGPPQVTP